MAIKRAIKAGNKSIISFKKVIKVGEITQLVSAGDFDKSKSDLYGVTFTNNGDGSWTLNGTCTTSTNYDVLYNADSSKLPIIKDHVYLVLDNRTGKISNTSYNATVQILNAQQTFIIGTSDNQEIGYGFKTSSVTTTCYMRIRIERGVTYNNVKLTPQLFDLTEMFGEGHEPATVAEFKAKFPESYYPYQRAVLTAYNKVVRPCARKGEVVQLLNKNTYSSTQTKSGITATNNGDGSWTINGTATKSDYINFSGYQITSIVGGHKILICGNKENSNFILGLLNQSISDTGTGAIGIFNQNAQKYWGIAWANGAVINNVTIYPQLFDLTAMYGAGNEPKTLADFRKDFPESYYPYNSIHTKNLWTCNKTAHFFSYNKTNQIYTINNTGSDSCYTLPSPIPAGQTFTISVKCLSGWIPADCAVNFGGYHKEGNITSWQTTVQLPREQDLTGKIFTATAKTTDTLTDFWIFIYEKIPTNLRVMIQFEKGSVATDYVPHDYI